MSDKRIAPEENTVEQKHTKGKKGKPMELPKFS